MSAQRDSGSKRTAVRPVSTLLMVLSLPSQTSSQHLSFGPWASPTGALDQVRTAQWHHRVDPTAILADNLPATHASETMKAVGLVTAGGIYATIQSAAMGGYGVGPVNGVVRAGALTSSAVIALRACRVARRGSLNG
jgi:hypothetical protein